ncbi:MULTISPECIES: hypothetical protein [Bradyrhizobium]|uniref:hypothetical protein n=1 Tax=Bradyrhizobium TaxID=374 RepID=UPI0004027699|nr:MULTISPECIES: hypothetical protein [Bradyrhizobium]UFW51276.1 hypothetical protein BaraCB756_09815 [Bradyrhizobium arachidis]
MLLHVSTSGRTVCLPDDDVPTELSDGWSKSAVSRRFELSAVRMAEWMSSDQSQLDLLAIQRRDGEHRDGASAPEQRTAADGSIQEACRFFMVDLANALTKATRPTVGRHTPIQRVKYTTPATSGLVGVATVTRLRLPKELWRSRA